MMVQIILLLIVILLVLLVIAAKKDSMSNKNKVIITLTSLVTLVIILIYESQVSQSSEKVRMIVNAYNQGKILDCEGYEVDMNRFLYVSGTQTFVAKKEQKELAGVVIQSTKCSIKE